MEIPEFRELKAEWHHNCTVTNVDEKGKEKICHGVLKEWMTAPSEMRTVLKPEDAIYRCRRCGACYLGKRQQHLTPGKGAVGLPPQFPVVR